MHTSAVAASSFPQLHILYLKKENDNFLLKKLEKNVFLVHILMVKHYQSFYIDKFSPQT